MYVSARLTLMIASLALNASATGQVLLPPAPVGVRTSHEMGIEFATIGSPGNQHPTFDNPWGPPLTRGSVNYEFRMARSELSTAQWVEFVNTFTTRGNFPARIAGEESFLTLEPAYYGGEPDTSYTGPGKRYRVVPGHENLPVFGISWRSAALYCNWLHNDKSPDLNRLWRGAYDSTTWTDPRFGPLGDEIAHEPGARFWIPTLDEWQKATFFDPNKDGPEQAGWWRYTNRSDDIPVSGLPGEGTTIEGVDFRIAIGLPLGAYGDLQSAWGLIDTAAGGGEWLEEPFPQGGGIFNARGVGGGSINSFASPFQFNNSIYGLRAAGYPFGTNYTTVRVAALVPGPSGLALIMFGAMCVLRRRHS